MSLDEEEPLTLLMYVLFVLCLFVMLVVSHFWFEGGTVVLIVLSFDCSLLTFYFSKWTNRFILLVTKELPPSRLHAK